MKRVLLLVALVACVGCGRTGPFVTAADPATESVVYGKCRFCGKPGYSSVNWLDTVEMQKRADEGDKEVLGTIVCGACRKGMVTPK